MSNIPKPQQIYQDREGNLFQIISLAEHAETKEMLVIYQAMYGDFKIYARQLSVFLKKAYKEKDLGADKEWGDKLQNEFSENRKTEALGKTKAEEKIDIDPLVLDFLDAGTYEERLDILAALHHRITDDMINIMAVALDVEVKEGDTEERYAELRKCLLLFDKFECSRLR